MGTLFRKTGIIAVVLCLFGFSQWILPGMGYLPTGGTNLIKIQIECYERVPVWKKKAALCKFSKIAAQDQGSTAHCAIPTGTRIGT